jgi:hypothetical protein
LQPAGRLDAILKSPLRREEAMMSIRYRKDVDRRPKAVVGRGLKTAIGAGRAGAGSNRRGKRQFVWPVIDQDRLTLVSLFIIAMLAALNFMLWFPDLGATIASLNRF